MGPLGPALPYTLICILPNFSDIHILGNEVKQEKNLSKLTSFSLEAFVVL